MEILDANDVIESLGLSYMRELSTFGALSDEVILDMLTRGVIKRFNKGEYVTRLDQTATEFKVVLRGKFAFYKHGEDCDVLTRYFVQGEQMDFDLMIGLIPHNGIDVATEDSLVLHLGGQPCYTRDDIVPTEAVCLE